MSGTEGLARPAGRLGAIGLPLLGVGLAVLGVPSWAALGAGLAVALLRSAPAPAAWKTWTTRSLQAGVILLGAGMNLDTVLRAGAEGALLTFVTLSVTLAVAYGLGRLLRVEPDTSLLIGVGTAICGGSAIAAVASVVKPKAHETSIALAIVFVLNAVALVVFPPLGAALGLSEPQFGLWAALAIHDTSSVVGAAMSVGPAALEIATTTKLARALWIVPITIAIALVRRSGRVRDIKWPWFILGFVVAAAAFTWIPALEPARGAVSLVGRRVLLLALFLVGLGLSRSALRTVGVRPLLQGLALWVLVIAGALVLVRW